MGGREGKREREREREREKSDTIISPPEYVLGSSSISPENVPFPKEIDDKSFLFLEFLLASS